IAGRYREGFALDETNLVYRSAKQLWQRAGYTPSGVSMRLVNNIPPSRGLGSSSAAIIGGLYSANIVAGSPFCREEILNLATDLEGHPDNVAAALYGGASLALRQPAGACIYRSLGQLNGLKMVAAVPSMKLSTKLARSLLPQSVSMDDAVWNLSCTGLLVTAFLTGDYSLLSAAMTDKLHEKYRSQAIPGMQGALTAAKEAGALAAVLSGAGPTLMAFLPDAANPTQVGLAMGHAFNQAGVECEIMNLAPDNLGATVIESFSQELTNLTIGGMAC
ncbi:MAG TPA: homoserine kinase, partial [Verrucomicrobiae bacterium]|nr:homoserine kinase [Verrucomicrobiae bacterium]